MLAPLPLSNGTVAAPSLTFASDPDTGLYRIGANNPAIAAGGVKAQEWTATTSAITTSLAVTGAQTNAAGVVVTQSTSNGHAVVGTGNGSGEGGVFTGGATGRGVQAAGGATSGEGVHGTGGGASVGGLFQGGPTNGDGIYGIGAAAGRGGLFEGGGTSGSGIVAFGGAPNGVGGVFEGSGTGAALEVSGGHAKFTGSNPASTAGFTNVQTPLNLIKGWAHITLTAGTPAVTAGFNVASVARNGNRIEVNWADDMSSAAYGVIATLGGLDSNSGANIQGFPVTAGQAGVEFTTGNTVGTTLDISLLGGRFTILILGAQ
jgi:hypothetical protein